MDAQETLDTEELRKQVDSLHWYHTVDLGQGVVTPGIYDHRSYLHLYGIPQDLTGKRVLDVGAASGFFSFEMERRGAQVTAIDLPAWFDHDFGPCYEPDQSEDEGLRYLQEPILLAKKALGSKIEKIETSIYDLSPETVGLFDLVFCGSLLLHLTDPMRALWALQSVTQEQAIIATVVHPDPTPEPLALFVGHHRGDVWWYPNRACLEAMTQSAGFSSWEWISSFQLDYRDGQPGPYHGVIRAWKEKESSAPTAETRPGTNIKTQDEQTELIQALAERDAEIARLRQLVTGYEQGRVMRLMIDIQGVARRLRGNPP